MTEPILLLSPDESMSRDGPVVPTIVDTMNIIAGHYGNAWEGTSSAYVAVPPSWIPPAGTVMARWRYRTGVSGASPALLIDTPAGGHFRLASSSAGAPRLYVGDGFLTGSGTVTEAATVNQVGTYNGSLSRVSLDGSPFASTAYTGAPATNVATRLSVAFNCVVESVLIYDTVLPDEEIATIRTMSGAWTWSALTASPRIFPVLKIGAPHIGPLRVGERN